MQLEIWENCGCNLSSQTFECHWSQSKIFVGLATINGTNILFKAKKDLSRVPMFVSHNGTSKCLWPGSKLEGQNVRNIPYPSRTRWSRHHILQLFFKSGHLNVRKISKVMVFRTFIGPSVQTDPAIKTLFIWEWLTYRTILAQVNFWWFSRSK